jgi:hypothetical protein
MSTSLLRDLAPIIRSKNAGPFLMTLDIIFDNTLRYEAVRDAAVISRESIATLYGISNADRIDVYYNDAARAIKVCMPSRTPSGHFRCTDVYGAQQYFPLLDIAVPWEETSN